MDSYDHDHTTAIRALNKTRRAGVKAIVIALCITVLFMLVQLVGGWIANSIALIADAAHMATDVVSFALNLFAFWIAARPATAKMSYGYYRAEILGAVASSLALWAISGFLIYEAIRRMLHPLEVRGGLMFIIAIITLGMNLITMRVLHRSQKKSLNVRAAYLHVLSDLLGNIGVILAGAIIFFTGWDIVDPLLTILFTALILFSTTRMLFEAVHILMEATPRHIDPAAVGQMLFEIPGVEEVHDLHIWTVTSGNVAMSAHLVCSHEEGVLDKAHEHLQHQYGIIHTTIQLEAQETFDLNLCFDCVAPDA